MICESSEDLWYLNRLVHDQFFVLDDVFFSPSDNVLEMKLADSCKGGFDSTLVFENVCSYDYIDTEKIGCYDVNYIKMDIEKQQIEIVCCVPLILRIKIEGVLKIVYETYNQQDSKICFNERVFGKLLSFFSSRYKTK